MACGRYKAFVLHLNIKARIITCVISCQAARRQQVGREKACDTLGTKRKWDEELRDT